MLSDKGRRHGRLRKTSTIATAKFTATVNSLVLPTIAVSRGQQPLTQRIPAMFVVLGLSYVFQKIYTVSERFRRLCAK
ncbi:hypothetical protein COCSADRAFT_161339 [Bipolaris sorokiniana ND90Pr]|uniref:Uncharacterized protein n=1 Tax=Cochliobolus sativus (strain ND90Pr / ATCC 201652) TaxID=665912 RepID=M2S6J8_COCSN|nr:uncharacterized protein COCSADRAFT_161339 [Bipolaris sorokiniana ND90Pr]EMD62773.1 hypothetical protein COCSADRAFT_161339 [Bipolaris sorokiniana ND90Pr]